MKYHGRASHASAYPWEGVNALDAAVMAYTNISVLRQQLKPDWKIHGEHTALTPFMNYNHNVHSAPELLLLFASPAILRIALTVDTVEFQVCHYIYNSNPFLF